MEHLTRQQRRLAQRKGTPLTNDSPPPVPGGGYKGPLIVITITAVILGAFFWFIWWASTPGVGEAFSDQGREHISVDDEHMDYNSNPPTSGPHAEPVGWGIYDQQQADERLVHNIEHGGIWISYKNLDPDELEQLKTIARKHPGSVVLSPRSQNDDRIAVASWKRLMRLEAVDIEQIETFIAKNKNKSPERLAR